MDASGNVFYHEGTHFVAFKPIAERLGSGVDWDNASKIASTTVDGKHIQVGMSNSQILVDSTLVNLDGKPFVDTDTLYVPTSLFGYIGHPL
ncbi:hypothetical protein BH11ARM2_BH11ARM2_19740 [soil metagenome]